MDILDIDKELKDDSFIFFEEKTHDDVSNILQQWKKNNILLPQPQASTDKVYQLNSKTFTRPKRKIALNENLDKQYINAAYTINSYANSCQPGERVLGKVAMPALNLEIGGLVTNTSNSRLQDTSPPMSICSSIEMSIEQMNNSNMLVKYAREEANTGNCRLNDIIYNHNSLDSLNNSADGTLIKDTEIAQIDDISIMYSKTNSGTSTMDNSTDSVVGETYNYDNSAVNIIDRSPTVLPNTMSLSEDMLMDTSMHLVEASMYGSTPMFKKHPDTRDPKNTETIGTSLQASVAVSDIIPRQANETFRIPVNTTIDSSINQGNTTFEYNTRCETPENLALTMPLLHESTPLPASSRCKKTNVSAEHTTELINSSPILPSGGSKVFSVAHTLDKTFEQCNKGSENLILNITQCVDAQDKVMPSNDTFNMTKLIATTSEIDVSNTIENELLTSNRECSQDDYEFERILEQPSKVILTSSQLKMKLSLDSIKKRFKCPNSNRHTAELFPADPTVLEPDTCLDSLHLSSDILPETNNHNPPTMNPASMYSSNGNGERLLGRRSRLYDDINLSTLSLPTKQDLYSEGIVKEQPSALAVDSLSVCNQTISESTDEDVYNRSQRRINSTVLVDQTAERADEKSLIMNSRSLNRRERESERFKTVRILKNPGFDSEPAQCKLKVFPSYVDDNNRPEAVQIEMRDKHQDTSSGITRRDFRQMLPHDSHMLEIDVVPVPKVNMSSHKNYLTFKKPKTRQIPQAAWQQSEKTQPSSEHEFKEISVVPIVSNTKKEPTLLSRPQQIGTLQKCFKMGKTISTSDLERCGASKTYALSTGRTAEERFEDTNNYNVTPALPFLSDMDGDGQLSKPVGELKSPMGIKSKSFHNLSRNSSNIIEPNRKNTRFSGLRKPSSGANEQKTKPEAIFRAPKAVSGTRVASSIQDGPEPRRGSMVRPSSGYYSLVTDSTKNITSQGVSAAESSIPQTSTDILLCQATRSSARNNLRPKMVNNPTTKITPANTIAASSTLTKFTTGFTGIPKPSNRLSGLPRPSSIVRR